MKTKLLIHQLSLDAAKAAIGWLAALLVLEGALHGFVSRFFNLDWMLLFALAAALVAFGTHAPAQEASGGKSGGRTMFRFLGLLAAAYAWLTIPAGVTWRLLVAFVILGLAMLLPIAFE